MSAALQRRVIMSALTALVLLVAATPLRAQHLLVPMDDAQSNHLKAYGLTFGALTDGVRSEWLLNFRGGSFLLPDLPGLRRAALLAGVTAEAIDDARLVDIRRQIATATWMPCRSTRHHASPCTRRPSPCHGTTPSRWR